MPRPRFTVRQVTLAALAVAALLAAFEAGRWWEQERMANIARARWLAEIQALQAELQNARKELAAAEKARAAAEPYRPRRPAALLEGLPASPTKPERLFLGALPDGHDA